MIRSQSLVLQVSPPFHTLSLNSQHKPGAELILDRLNHTFEEGRSDIAPELSFMDTDPMMLFVLQKYMIKNYHV